MWSPYSAPDYDVFRQCSSLNSSCHWRRIKQARNPKVIWTRWLDLFSSCGDIYPRHSEISTSNADKSFASIVWVVSKRCGSFNCADRRLQLGGREGDISSTMPRSFLVRTGSSRRYWTTAGPAKVGRTSTGETQPARTDYYPVTSLVTFTDYAPIDCTIRNSEKHSTDISGLAISINGVCTVILRLVYYIYNIDNLYSP